jgi:hypothetical protein
MRYEYVVGAVNIDIDLYDAFTEIKDVAIAPNSNALRLAMAPRKSVSPLAEFPKSGTMPQISG